MIYANFASDLVSGNISPQADTFFVLLVNGYKFDAAHSRRTDVEPFEASANGYDRGGKHTPCSITRAGGRVTLMFSDVQWAISGRMDASGGVLYKSRGGAPSSDELVSYLDFGKVASCTDSTFTAHFASGLGIGT